ncbi:flagellar biosynthetic protein FliQ [Planctomyces sp. SH-PL14]|uniref:flagellar biosynthetic protein FliQ n=1 Tax=Planctomyces sp. SH-PL14 TaxID=1632864 RepID=UPI00078D9362|nr:flagellar biosynthetic protein FliQ [Planctomyces sp. SH-PL14]AMV21560.1 Flagellar biosynthetic protein FliQ [Planctomyces sp. SH-PL14]
MSSLQVMEIGRDLLWTALWLSLPAVGVSLLVGLTISILQTLTSVQEQTLSFAPRIAAVCLILVLALPWMLRTSTAFTTRMVARMVEVTK